MLKKILYITLILSVLNSCKKTTTAQAAFTIQLRPIQSEYHEGDTIEVYLTNKQFSEDIKQELHTLHTTSLLSKADKVVLKDIPLGKQKLKVDLLTTDGKRFTAQKEITGLAKAAPEIYHYKIIAEYPHDKTAFTQGLEFIGDTLVESTGEYGESVIRKWNPFTGQVYKNVPLKAQYFGEGVTVFNDQVLQLTWREAVGFVYDKNLNYLRSFPYHKSKEGWGLCHNGKDKLYKSDGSEKIWILHPKTFSEVDSLQLCTNTSIFSNANELEYAEGKIYANTFLKDGIMIINPHNGAIEGVVDVRGLKDKVEQTPNLDVLNGIAYHPQRKTFFITGKRWSKIFEVVFIK